MRTRLWLVLLTAAAAACGGASSLTAQEKRMPSDFTISSSRIGQPDVPPISFEGKRYEQITGGDVQGLSQRTGLMAVYDDVSNKRVEVVAIYTPKIDPQMEEDAQDVFFTSFELDRDKRQILIENEHGERFAYRIDERSVRALK